MTEEELESKRQEIAQTLKKRREELKLTQQELADKVSMSRETISRMEAGKFWLGMKQYLLICEALRLFPAIAEMEAKDEIAEALRSNWTAKPKAMSIEDALKLKESRYNKDGQHH